MRPPILALKDASNLKTLTVRARSHVPTWNAQGQENVLFKAQKESCYPKKPRRAVITGEMVAFINKSSSAESAGEAEPRAGDGSCRPGVSRNV